MSRTKTNAKPVRLDPQEAKMTKLIKSKTGLSEAEIIRRSLKFALPKFLSKEVDLLDYGSESK